MIKLSICIPTFKRPMLLEKSLNSILNSTNAHKGNLEVIISDNDPDESARSVFLNFQKLESGIEIRYYSNKKNYGPGYNYFQAVKYATGDFAWLIGDDDLIIPRSIDLLLLIIESNSDIDLVIFECEYSSLSLIDFSEFDLANQSIKNAVSYGRTIDFIHPRYNNVYLGAMMKSVFRTSKWKKVKVSKQELLGFDSLVSMYPHVHVFSQGFMYSNAIYFSKKLVTVLDDTRSWSSKDKFSYWGTVEPYIYFRIIHEIILNYRKNGLGLKNYLACLNYNSVRVGELLVRSLINSFLKGNSIKYKRKYKLLGTTKYYAIFPGLYYGVVKGVLKEVLHYGY